MFIRTLATLALTASLSWSATSYASTVGPLTWDGSSDFITQKSSDTRYIQFGAFNGLTASAIDDKTAKGGVWEGFKLATQAQAYSFFNLIAKDTIKDEKPGREMHTSTINGTWSDGLLGNNFDKNPNNIADVLLFKSDVVASGYGTISFLSDGRIRLSETSSWNDRRASQLNIGRLLIENSPVSAVPVPAAAFLFAPALLGFLGLRRKNRA